MEEFCEGETFRIKCRSDEVILTESAYYGRMRLGRCVKVCIGEAVLGLSHSFVASHQCVDTKI